jgi:hypothetical protein
LEHPEGEMASRAEIFKRYGITDRPEMRVQTIKEGDSPLWVVGINGTGDPIKALSSKHAIELSIGLRQIGEDKLANDISAAAAKAHKSNITTKA